MSKQSKRPMPERPDDAEKDLNVKTGWLLKTYAFCPPLDKVVDMYKAHAVNCLLKRDAFVFTYRGWNEPRRGAGGGILVKPRLATDAWTDHKLIVNGIRMRPDQPFPLFEENGEKFKNVYCQPEHTGAGDIAPLLTFMERFLPDEKQREWLYDWMAHKQSRPEIPGTAVLFVADTDDGVREGKFGTGRGMFFKVMHKLYGEEYSRAEDFDILDGSSGQAAYTDWRHNSVLITIDEAKSSPTSYRRGERSAVYEVLKNIVDPAPKRCRFKSKYGVPFDGVSYASFMVACNHADAIAIPANDRRFTVLVNGREMTVEEEKAFAAWMEVPGNIAELSRFLATRELKDFNMFRPLDTAAKQDMAELALTQVEGILRDLMEDDKQELVFTRYQMEREVETVLKGGVSNGGYPGHWRGEFEAAWKQYCALLKTANGSPSRVRVSGKLAKLYCFRTRKKQVEKLPEAARQQSARKRGGIDKAKDQIAIAKALSGLTNAATEFTESEE
jgi:Family of unknown function (DUF5906)